MTIRRNGFSNSSRENFQGNPGFFTVVVDSDTGSIHLDDTGVVQPLNEFKRHHIKDLLNPNDGTLADISALDAKLRTFKGSVIASDFDYEVAYYRQLNMNRVVDVITQKTVIIGTSVIGTTSAVDLTDTYFAEPTSVSSVLPYTVNDASLCTFIGERYNVFEKEIANPVTGVPEKTDYISDNLLNDILQDVSLYADSGLKVTDTITGIVATVTVNDGGTGYSAQVTPVHLGKGLYITWTVTGDVIDAVTVTSGGSDYEVGDSLDLSSFGNGDADVTVATLDTDGTIVKLAGIFDTFNPFVG